jgi:hypothetical protein
VSFLPGRPIFEEALHRASTTPYVPPNESDFNRRHRPRAGRMRRGRGVVNSMNRWPCRPQIIRKRRSTSYPELLDMQAFKTPVPLLATPILVTMLVTAALAQTASPERIDEIAARGAHVMPFDLKRTRHVFTRTPDGGLQRVVARVPSDSEQIALIREHLTKISRDFSQGDFSDPEKIHGEQMPGLAELRTAKPGQLRVEYRELPDGGEIIYASDDAALVAAVHRWFDAQLTDHGRDATPGPEHGTLHHGMGH